jgi:AcrR family transcriptional regulator
MSSPKIETETRTRILAATLQLMEQRRGQGVRMSDIAKAAGVSRQAVYLHFGSRTELMVAATHYGDEVHGLDQRLQRYRQAASGVDKLQAFVEFWGNYLPEIYGIATALLTMRETDEAAAAAWNDRMATVREGCISIIEDLQRDGMLAPEWPADKAIDLLWTLLSVRNWEQLTRECGWSAEQYIEWMQTLLRRTLLRSPADR